MQTQLSSDYRSYEPAQEAEKIIRTCVHCGFCLATCPTYQILGNELDSPRGRIYLMKQMLEGEAISEKTQLHLDRCLTCRACETACPSGVAYGHLVDIGRHIMETKVQRNGLEALQRYLLRKTLSHQTTFLALLRIGQFFRWALPFGLKKIVPARRRAGFWPANVRPRKMLVLGGCVQPGLAPDINAAAARVLDKLGVSLTQAAQAGCCGALSFHLNKQEEAKTFMRRNIDAWWPYVEQGAEAIVMTASGCGVLVKDYGQVLRGDIKYAEKARRIAELTLDLSEVIGREKNRIPALIDPERQKIKLAVHAPCTLQHGQKITGVVEAMLIAAGFDLVPVADGHLCCGSAGTYSILQKPLAQVLLQNKVTALEKAAPDYIVTANIGCLTHIQSGTAVPVKHWIEALDERMT